MRAKERTSVLRSPVGRRAREGAASGDRARTLPPGGLWDTRRWSLDPWPSERGVEGWEEKQTSEEGSADLPSRGLVAQGGQSQAGRRQTWFLQDGGDLDTPWAAWRGQWSRRSWRHGSGRTRGGGVGRETAARTPSHGLLRSAGCSGGDSLGFPDGSPPGGPFPLMVPSLTLSLAHAPGKTTSFLCPLGTGWHLNENTQRKTSTTSLNPTRIKWK